MSHDRSDASANREESDRVQVNGRITLSNQWAHLESVRFNFKRSDGQWQIQQREIYHRGHGAAILLFNLVNNTVVLTRQFRFPAWDTGGDGFLLEVPAGIMESDNPHGTITKETAEETGFIIDEASFLFKAYASPGSVTEQLHYFCAAYEPGKRSGEGGGLAEEGEDIEVLEVDINEAAAWIRDGKIIDAKTIVLIQYAQLYLFDRQSGSIAVNKSDNHSMK